MPDITTESLGGTKTAIENAVMEAMLKSTKLKDTLNRYVDENWYRPRPESEYYDRTGQLKESADLQLNEDNKSVDLFLNPEKLTPKKSDNLFSSYMNFNGDTSAYGRTVSDWVVDWIEEGNKMYAGRNITKGAEESIKRTGLAEKEIVRNLKNMGISSKVV